MEFKPEKTGELIPNPTAQSGYGTLYCVGTGPGDPELLTLKAARLLQTTPVVFVPQQGESGRTQALDIVNSLVDDTRQRLIRLQFPMTRQAVELEAAWDIATARIVAELAHGQDAVLPVLGDPLLYGTFNYILERLQRDYRSVPVIVVPGITSIQAASAAAQQPLAEAHQRIAILPALYEVEPARFEQTLQEYDTVVLMKLGSKLAELLPSLIAHDRLNGAIYAERLGMTGQRIVQGPQIAGLAGETLPYFSLLIIRK